ncbi:LTA synthase family protein [Ornithinibacillus halophilus]|uniref:Uncharacterized sulfatase n=1 Tax=Ornithinibacillus halophilus TaxID=930117 RepID=A0A1M5D291_9BACI|nr:LTA synthase family protein [Ornithinibacillus halophilus]SHF60942.1 uncharacterized sulfatase [Ornithinibacillus halophilus]
MVFKRGNIPLYVIATALFGLKTYFIYRFMFNISLDNFMQEFILFINPFVSAFLVLGISVWIKKDSRRMKFIRYTMLIGTLIIFANLVFYRSFTDFITIPQLFQGSNAGDLGNSILSLMKFYDVLFFVDVVIIWVLTKKMKPAVKDVYPRSNKVFVTALSLALLAGNFFLAEIERPQLFTRAFDREYLVKNIGLFNYHIYDIVLHSKVKSQRVFADDNELKDVEEYIDTIIKNDEQSELFGVAEGKNVIFISAESIQSFVINEEVNGQEITPFMNRLIDDEDTYYFENFYHQTEQGKTSDSEFIVENSLYPLSRGAVYFTHGQNEYHALPEIIKQKDYYSAVFHANNRSFWNRDQMYEVANYDHFFDEEAYEINDTNSVGWGLKDKDYFEQSIKYLQNLEEPFYSKFITLTNHFPFELDDEDRSIEPYNSNSNTLNNYFPTVRYMDESIEEFFTLLEEAGLYEDSIIVIMGDHDGISANHNKAMSMFLEKEEITPYDQIQLQRVPFFIHIPGHGEGRVISDIAGQIDVKPTLLHMLGIDTANDLYFGNDLFIEDRKEYIALRNGDFISDDFVYTTGVCYDRANGEVIETESNLDTDSATESVCQPIKEQVEKELSLSDKLIYGDLLRFVNFDEE